jgi:hypothetical protein
VARGEHPRTDTWLSRLGTAEVVVANAIPVIGVWILGWQAERAIFFYWLDGLLAMWGLGVVAVIVTSREGPKGFGASGAKLWLIWVAVVGTVLAILAIPSVIAGAMVLSFLRRDLGEVLRAVFGSAGVWTGLVVVAASYSWRTLSELLWKPEITLKETGQERGNLFIHRTLLMGMLVAWTRWRQPSHWELALYVLLVACLYTYTQLYPDRYLELIGIKRAAAVGTGEGPRHPARANGDGPSRPPTQAARDR